MNYFTKIATTLVLVLGLTSCGERPPIPAGDGSSGDGNNGDETSVEAVLPSCRTADHVSGSYSYTVFNSGGNLYQNGTGTMYLYCLSNPNDTGVSLIWGNVNSRANFTAYYAGNGDWTQDWMSFDFVAPDGFEYLTQSFGGSGACHHSGGVNRWRCPAYVRFPGGGLGALTFNFIKQ